MKKEKIKEFLLKTKPFFTKSLIVISISIAIVASFFIGQFVENYKNKKGDDGEQTTKIVKIKKQDVNIAIDEYNNLIIFDNHSGEYLIYEDSIGQTIFKIYARNIWIKNNPE